jgi:gamma-glutamyltranspeptidase/glutathione hydrolase
VHITQMLNILEGFDIAGLGFGTTDSLHLLAEAMKIAFADRAEASGDPAFVKVPVGRITSKAYADERRAGIDMTRTRKWTGALAALEGADTTHLTAADGKGNVVCTTQTINSLFGARFIVPGTGMIPNNYMSNYDPRPGHALSIAPGKRVTTSMSPVMALKAGRVVYALGLPGGRKIFPSALQALLNLIDHGMALQEAVEAPRIWTEGPVLEVEHGVKQEVRSGLAERGHKVQVMPTVAGGMNAIEFHDDGSMTGAACWRADGVALAAGGGLARAGVRFVLPR